MKIVEKGNFGLVVQVLNSDGTYSATVKAIDGLMKIELESSQETANIPADDLPDYYTSRGPLILTGTLTLAGVPLADYKELFDAIEDKNGVVIAGGYVEVKKLGLAFKNRASDGSINQFTLNNVNLTLPPIKTATLDESGTTIREFAIPITANPYEYTDEGGDAARVTYSILNSTKNATIWESANGKIYVPDTTIA